ncbi:MAG: L-threonylcarbamoyladenylate synthase [Acidobacteria bacterium]|nr:L-threonylcarbamoyladenylate synthase [Acidobacteriota bacterium]
MVISEKIKDFAKIAAEHLGRGSPVVFPTETVYGIGSSIQKEEHIKRIVELKGREEKKPIAIMCANLDISKKYFEFEKEEIIIAQRFLPGPITLLLKRKETIPQWFYPDFIKIGLRIPNNETALKILESYGKPVASTSANISGQKEAKSFEDVCAYFGKFSDVLIVDGGKIERGKPSSVIEYEKGEIRVLRQGEITLQMVKEALNEK